MQTAALTLALSRSDAEFLRTRVAPAELSQSAGQPLVGVLHDA